MALTAKSKRQIFIVVGSLLSTYSLIIVTSGIFQRQWLVGGTETITGFGTAKYNYGLTFYRQCFPNRDDPSTDQCGVIAYQDDDTKTGMDLVGKLATAFFAISLIPFFLSMVVGLSAGCQLYLFNILKEGKYQLIFMGIGAVFNTAGWLTWSFYPADEVAEGSVWGWSATLGLIAWIGACTGLLLVAFAVKRYVFTIKRPGSRRSMRLSAANLAALKFDD